MNIDENYSDFLNRKSANYLVTRPSLNGDAAIHRVLFDFQRDIIKWALQLGKAAVFAECGLGKTLIQCEWARHVPGRTLILAPLAVAQQTVREAKKLDMEVRYCRAQSEVDSQVTVTNYEMLDHFKADTFAGVVLDESSILKAFMGSRKRQIIDAFRRTKYKLACTATPAPNDHMELGNHSDFLDVMPSNEMLARFFINDSMQFGHYRLKGHAVKAFWEWVSTWGVCIQKPSDMGYEDGPFMLPELTVETVIVKADRTRATDGALFRLPVMDSMSLHREMRLTASERARATADIVNALDEPCVVWVNTNYDADAVRPMIPGGVEIRGSEPLVDKERKLIDFSEGRARVLITKPKIAGFGLNWQHCNRAVFMGLGYSYESLYQAVRRIWRFGQARPVSIYLVSADTEANVREVLNRKQQEHEQMQANMYGVNFKTHHQGRLSLKIEAPQIEYRGRSWRLMHSDCVDFVKTLPDDGLHFTIFSPPFSSLYIYSDSIRDMGNSENDEEFMRHFGFLIPEIYRATMPNRLCAVHCKNLVNYKNRDGRAGLRDFRGDIIRAFQAHNWAYHSEVTIWKDPVLEMQRTKAHGLLYKQLRKDATFCRQGLAEYLVVFRKWGGENAQPVTHQRQDFPLEDWQDHASPVWMDIRPTDVVNARIAREDHDEKHIAPLQLGLIERALRIWTNPGEVVLDPFAGVCSVGIKAIQMGRQFIGSELKASYVSLGVRYLKEAEMNLGTLL